jgi:hypothetical protein
MAGVPPEFDNGQRAVAANATERRLLDTGCLALVIVLVGLLALTALVGVRLNRRPVVAQPAAPIIDTAALPSAGEPVATAVQVIAEGVGTPVAAAALGVEAGVTAFDAALQATPAAVAAVPPAVVAAPTLPVLAEINAVQDGGIVWRCPNGCAAVPICADGAPLKAYTRADPSGAVTRVYFTRDDPGYGDLAVDAAAGDLWFCTEEEAAAAGFAKGQ